MLYERLGGDFSDTTLERAPSPMPQFYRLPHVFYDSEVAYLELCNVLASRCTEEQLAPLLGRIVDELPSVVAQEGEVDMAVHRNRSSWFTGRGSGRSWPTAPSVMMSKFTRLLL